MSEHKFETFSYTPIELAASMTGTINETLSYLLRHGYIKQSDYDNLSQTLAVYPMPNRKGYGKKLLERFFGKDDNENAYVFPIVEIDPVLRKSTPKDTKPNLNVVSLKKDKQDE